MGKNLLSRASSDSPHSSSESWRPPRPKQPVPRFNPRYCLFVVMSLAGLLVTHNIHPSRQQPVPRSSQRYCLLVVISLAGLLVTHNIHPSRPHCKDHHGQYSQSQGSTKGIVCLLSYHWLFYWSHTTFIPPDNSQSQGSTKGIVCLLSYHWQFTSHTQHSSLQTTASPKVQPKVLSVCCHITGSLLVTHNIHPSRQQPVPRFNQMYCLSVVISLAVY